MTHSAKLLTLAAVAVAMGACSASRSNGVPAASAPATEPTASSLPVEGIPTEMPRVLKRIDRTRVSMIPRAVIYKTNGNYADCVPVTLNADGRSLQSFPGPGDVSPDSRPLPLADGWLLDRRGGIGPNTAFLTYTYAQYAALPAVPSMAELMARINKSARVTEAVRLTIPATPADTAACNRLIRDGLPGCKPIVQSFSIESPLQVGTATND